MIKKSLILSGVLFSGLMLGTTVTPAVVNAADKTEDTATTDTTKDVTATINYYDAKGNQISSETVTGAAGTTHALKNIPSGYALQNASDKNIILVQPKDSNSYNQTVFVNAVISNNIIFKTADQTQVGTTTVSSLNVGDKVDLTDAQVPSGYAVADKSVTIQADKNTQIITVTKVDPISNFKGVVTTGDSAATTLYSKTGDAIKSRALSANSAWSVDKKLVLSGVTYYRVATTEWVKADDVTVKADSSTDTNTSTAPYHSHQMTLNMAG